MKKYTLIFVLLLYATVGQIIHVNAQNVEKWRFGLSGNYGKDRYSKRFFNYVPDPRAETVMGYKSKFTWAVGIWGERFATPHLSVIGQLGYRKIGFVTTSIFCDCGTTGQIVQKDEFHHWTTLGGGLRWYVNPKSNLKIFLEGKVDADYFLARTLTFKLGRDENMTHWDAYGYRRLVPSFSGGIGMQWKRLSVMAEYDRHIGKYFTRNVGIHYGLDVDLKTNFLRQGFTVKTALTLIRSK